MLLLSEMASSGEGSAFPVHGGMLGTSSVQQVQSGRMLPLELSDTVAGGPDVMGGGLLK